MSSAVPTPSLVFSDFPERMVELLATHDDALVLSGDLGDSCGLTPVRARFPERYIDCGLTEQNMCSWAAGLAREGLRPFCVSFGVFLYRRALDQIEMSIAASELPVVLVGFVPGITSARGISHQAINDVSVLRSVPGMTIIDCGDAAEVSGALEAAYQAARPTYIRMLRYWIPSFLPADTPFELGHIRELSRGSDLTIISSSIMTAEALRATKALTRAGISVTHLHVSTPAPLDAARIEQACRAASAGVITLENQLTTGGLGSAVAEIMAAAGLATPLVRLGLAHGYARSGSLRHLLETYHMDAATVIGAAERLLGRTLNIGPDELGEALL